MGKILIAEDKESMAKMLMQALAAAEYESVWAKDGREAIQQVRDERFDLIITDLKLPYKDGLAVLEAAREFCPRTPVILMTAYGTIETAVKAVKEGAYDFLTKPFDPDHLLLLIDKALEKQRLVTENVVLREEMAKHLKVPKIIGKSPAMAKSLESLQKVAASSTTVLLMGESGTGKELFARAIHYISPRKDGPFVAINCAAIPHDLLESELFGHEKGAFTGAVGRRIGKFELADRGTLFLDEIGEMDLGLQSKLLRVLEDDEITRVGGTVKVKVDVRLVAASNRNLQAAIGQKLFREDLFYRLSVFPIVIPPLRERKEDIPVLAEHFLDVYSHELKKPIRLLTPEAETALMNHAWSGNVRELQNCMERAVILAEGETIGPELLNLKSRESSGEAAPLPMDATLHEVGAAASRAAETRMIQKVLKETNGNKSRAAEILQVSYKTLLTKIKDFGIE
ncbi:MAG: sigma-54-dependent Fis family transcriptional regulator [Nitrospirae bacterium]|nr:sigma-54-dependent Fis family transcriptional regulator [Nitrospirota bacterium]